MGRDPPRPGSKSNIGRMSKRTLESWAAHYNILHVAEDLPLEQRAMAYQRALAEIQRQNPDQLVHGQKMERVSMSESQWPNRTHYRKRGVADAPGPSRSKLKQLHKEKEEKRDQRDLKRKAREENKEQKHSVENDNTSEVSMQLPDIESEDCSRRVATKQEESGLEGQPRARGEALEE